MQAVVMLGVFLEARSPAFPDSGLGGFKYRLLLVGAPKFPPVLVQTKQVTSMCKSMKNDELLPVGKGCWWWEASAVFLAGC